MALKSPKAKTRHKGSLDQYQQRYATWPGAEYGHDKVVALVTQQLAETKPE